MARTPDIDLFVREALTAGHARGEIAGELSRAGWRPRDIDRALALYADTGFLPPVPRPQAYVSARDGFLYGLTFVALVVTVTNLVSALFEMIEYSLGESTRLNLTWDVAALLVFVPVFVLLDRYARRGGRDETPLRKIFAFGALFCASLVLLGGLVAVLALALGGGLGIEVTLKALVVAVIAGLVLLNYRRDLREGTASVPKGDSR